MRSDRDVKILFGKVHMNVIYELRNDTDFLDLTWITGLIIILNEMVHFHYIMALTLTRILNP